jgi:hypothetical protein
MVDPPKTKVSECCLAAFLRTTLVEKNQPSAGAYLCRGEFNEGRIYEAIVAALKHSLLKTLDRRNCTTSAKVEGSRGRTRGLD